MEPRAITYTLDQAAEMTLFKLRPLPGRTHQLRVHCARGLDGPILGNVTMRDLNGVTVVEGLSDTPRHACVHPPHLAGGR